MVPAGTTAGARPETHHKEGRAMKTLLTVLVGMTLASGALVASEPIQLSLTPEIAIFNRTERIEGLAKAR